MSFAVPRNVLNFESTQRSFEDNVWSKVTGNEKSLPMYKDKPSGKGYGYGVKSRKGFVRSRRGVALIALAVIGILYWFGWSSTPTDLQDAAGKATEAGKTLTSLVGAGKGGLKNSVDWSKRREAVKDAFLKSWKAYEEHGWGEHPFTAKRRIV
jgi:hypothetical protein